MVSAADRQLHLADTTVTSPTRRSLNARKTSRLLRENPQGIPVAVLSVRARLSSARGVVQANREGRPFGGRNARGHSLARVVPGRNGPGKQPLQQVDWKRPVHARRGVFVLVVPLSQTFFAARSCE